jgi:hypothetical protein
MMPSGEKHENTATLTFSHSSQRKSINQSINQIHSHYPSHAHQLHISQSDIAPRSNVHWLMHSGEASNHPATHTFAIKANFGQYDTSKTKLGLILSVEVLL